MEFESFPTHKKRTVHFQLLQRQLQKSGAELSGQSNDEEHTLRGDSPTHESMSTPIDIYGSPGEGMHEVESRTPRVNGKGPLADGDAANKSSSALATTASTCQVPGSNLQRDV
jgi:hypothetical protein